MCLLRFFCRLLWKGSAYRLTHHRPYVGHLPQAKDGTTMPNTSASASEPTYFESEDLPGGHLVSASVTGNTIFASFDYPAGTVDASHEATPPEGETMEAFTGRDSVTMEYDEPFDRFAERSCLVFRDWKTGIAYRWNLKEPDLSGWETIGTALGVTA